MKTPPQPIEGLIIDFDGTLAGITHIVSPRVREALKRAREKVHVSLCTGRPYLFVADLARDLGLEGFHVAEGGGRVVDAHGAIIWERLMLPETVERMSHAALQEGMEILAQIEGDDHVGWALPSRREDFPALAHVIYHSLERERTEHALARIQRDFKDVHAILTHYQDGDGPVMWGVDVTAQDANKQHALLHIAQKEGLDPKQFMAIGDGYNDFPLLIACGTKVAMGNAHSELKAIADYIAPSVDEDGVAEVIERFVLQEAI